MSIPCKYFLRMPKQVKIPTKLQAKDLDVEDPQVGTDFSISRVYDAKAINQLENLGLIKVDGARFQDLGELGRHIKGLGMVNFINGGFALTLNSVTQAMGMLDKIVSGEIESTPKERNEAAKVIGYLAGQLARASSSVTRVGHVQVMAAREADKATRRSFAPGMVIPVDAMVKPAPPE